MLGALVSIVTESVSFFRERQQAKHKLKMNVLSNKQQLAISKQSHNEHWEMASLESSDRLLRFISFSLFALPLIITVIQPEMGKAIFLNLESAPTWYVQTFIAINGGIWGIVELKHAAPAFIANIKQIFKKSPNAQQ